MSDELVESAPEADEQPEILPEVPVVDKTMEEYNKTLV